MSETKADIVNYAPAARKGRRDFKPTFNKQSKKKKGGMQKLTPSMSRAISRAAKQAVKREAEIKYVYGEVDEKAIDPYVGNQFLDNSGFTSSNSSVCFSSPNQDVVGQGRIGNEVTPMWFEAKGHISFTLSTNASHRESIVRIIWGFRDEPSTLNPGADDLILKNGNSQPLTGDFTDLYADIYWKNFRPFYDELHTITPQVYVDVTTPSSYSLAKGQDYAFFHVKHKFGPKARMRFNTNNATDGLADNNNIMCLVICRNLQDDTIVTTNKVEVSALTKFAYIDP